MSSSSTLYLWDPNYYRLGYQLLAQRQHARLTDTKGSTDYIRTAPSVLDPEQFLKEIRDTRETLRARATTPRWKLWVKRPTNREEKLARFLERTVEPCVVLVIAAGDGSGLEPGDVEDVRKRADAHELSYRALYNLACFEASRNSNRASLALDRLQQALRAARGLHRNELLSWAQADPAFDGIRGEPRFKKLIALFADLTCTPAKRSKHAG